MSPELRCLACQAPIASLSDHCRCEVIVRCPRCGREQWAERLPDDGDADVIEVVCEGCEVVR